MKIHFIGALLCSAAIALVAITGAFAQNKNNGIGDGKAGSLGVGDRKPSARNGGPTMRNGDFEKNRSAKTGVNTGPAGAAINTSRSMSDKKKTDRMGGGARSQPDSKGFEIGVRH